jgi:hypothetical protein
VAFFKTSSLIGTSTTTAGAIGLYFMGDPRPAIIDTYNRAAGDMLPPSGPTDPDIAATLGNKTADMFQCAKMRW